MSARGVAILGSTGSIGCNTFRVLEALGPEKFRVVALAAGRKRIESFLQKGVERGKTRLSGVKMASP